MAARGARSCRSESRVESSCERRTGFGCCRLRLIICCLGSRCDRRSGSRCRCSSRIRRCSAGGNGRGAHSCRVRRLSSRVCRLSGRLVRRTRRGWRRPVATRPAPRRRRRSLASGGPCSCQCEGRHPACDAGGRPSTTGNHGLESVCRCRDCRRFLHRSVTLSPSGCRGNGRSGSGRGRFCCCREEIVRRAQRHTAAPRTASCLRRRPLAARRLCAGLRRCLGR